MKLQLICCDDDCDDDCEHKPAKRSYCQFAVMMAASINQVNEVIAYLL